MQVTDFVRQQMAFKDGWSMSSILKSVEEIYGVTAIGVARQMILHRCDIHDEEGYIKKSLFNMEHKKMLSKLYDKGVQVNV